MGSRSRSLLALSSIVVAAVAVAGHVAYAQRGMTGTFITVNDYTDKWMWVTLYESTIFSRSISETACVAPKGTINFVRPRGGGYPLGAKHYIRAEVTVRNCAHPVSCDTTITAYPSLGGEALHLIPNGNNCFWEAKKTGLRAEPTNLQAGAGGRTRLLVRNGQDLALWVNLAGGDDRDARGRRDAFCIPAGKERAWDASYGATYGIRGIVASSRECHRGEMPDRDRHCMTAIRLKPSVDGNPPRPRDTEVTLLRDGRNCYFRSDN